MGRTYGRGFWVFMAYTYVIMAGGVVALLRSLPRARVQRQRTLMLIGGMLLPLTANMAYLFDWFPVRYLDITPYAFGVTGICLFVVIFRYRFQGIVPIAMKSVVSSMTDGVIVLDLDRRVADLNPAAEALLGHSKRELAGRRMEPGGPCCAGLAPFLESAGNVTGDVALDADGRRRLCAVSAVDIVLGGLSVGRVITLRDVTAERAASVQLQEARQAAEGAAVAKSRFLANMSHEIRTPMNAVVGAMELLLDFDLNAEQQELVETAQESAHCLLSIINDILDFSKIDAGRLDLEQVPFDLHRLMDQIVRLMQPVAAKKNLALKLRIAPGVPRVIVGDPTRLRQVVLNLAANAIKFTKTGRVSIGIDRLAAELGPARLVLTVKDTGIGIAPDRIGALFQEFNQADSTVTRKFGGTGLGLAISQRLVEKMGGTIRVESILGLGSEFIVETPIRLASGAQLETAPRASLVESETFPGCRVLLAEDNAVNQKIGQRILEKLGCLVKVANNGREAIDLAAVERCDVILMDLHMPEVDGLQAARAIRRQGLRTPIIALTASVLDETRRACEAAGMDGFLAKPIRMDEIAAVLQRYPAHTPGADVRRRGAAGSAQ
jgi:signal transduction histidine kinase/CheY-like chemotaxis protein